MIITRSPLRISLGGGGTDLPSYYREHGGFLIAAAIDKYVYITVHPAVRRPASILKYSKLEHVDGIDEVQHPIIREAMRLIGFQTPQLEITTLADIPAGTGLGSSGSFTTALLKALTRTGSACCIPSELAEQACEIEIDRLGEPIGKQDQYIAAYGGLTCFAFHPDGTRRRRAADDRRWTTLLRPRRQPAAVLHRLLAQRRQHPHGSEDAKREQRRGDDRQPALRQGARPAQPRGARRRATCTSFGELMHEHWEHKKQRSGGMSNPQIDEWYELGR